MASTAAYIVHVIFGAARRQLRAAVAFLAAGNPQPQLIPIRVHATQAANSTHPARRGIPQSRY